MERKIEQVVENSAVNQMAGLLTLKHAARGSVSDIMARLKTARTQTEMETLRKEMNVAAKRPSFLREGIEASHTERTSRRNQWNIR